jgi:hypothetical protein
MFKRTIFDDENELREFLDNPDLKTLEKIWHSRQPVIYSRSTGN